jgi:hypothetical protein
MPQEVTSSWVQTRRDQSPTRGRSSAERKTSPPLLLVRIPWRCFARKRQQTRRPATRLPFSLSFNVCARVSRLPSEVVGVRHEVAEVTVLRSEDRLPAPAVLPAVSYRDHKPRDHVASSLARAAQARAVTATASSQVVGNPDRVVGANPGEGSERESLPGNGHRQIHAPTRSC